MEKTKKNKIRKPQPKKERISGLPVLRGMFVYPESISDCLPSFSDLVSYNDEGHPQNEVVLEG